MRRRSAEGGLAVGPPRVPLRNQPRVRGAFYQVLLLAIFIGLGTMFWLNARANIEASGFASGFGFLQNTAGFGVSQSLIPYTESDSYGRVFFVGLLNTLLVAGVGIVFATLLGFVVGIARLSPNWLVARLGEGYVELIRNLPLLFQILFWYLAALGTLPGPRQSIAIGWQPLVLAAADGMHWLEGFGLPAVASQWLRGFAGVIGAPDIYLNNRGLIVPRPLFGEGAGLVVAAVLVAIVAALVVRMWATRRRHATGQPFPVLWVSLGLLVALPAATSAALGFPIGLEHPELRGFNFNGGLRLIPEFVALELALVTYTAAFIAEIVRGGILAVSRGQTEAALALGLARGPMLRLVIIPQALRVIIPPLTNQYLNLTKNSSLAVAIGYPDLFALFAGTTLNQTHQAIEIIAVTMAVYLLISLITSVSMNVYNARLQAAER
jgi:general L-amino acid transport system permease protein